MKLDYLDQLLLSHLQKNASLTHQQLSTLLQVSTPTCQRRVKRLKKSGVIDRTVAILDATKVGDPLIAILEVSLLTQDAETLDRFEQLICALESVQQCYRLSTGADFLLIVSVADMAQYHAFAHLHLTAVNKVRNVRTFFSIRRSKFGTNLAIKKSDA